MIEGTGDTVITDWSPDDGDKITFLGAFAGPDHLREYTQVTEGTEGSPVT